MYSPSDSKTTTLLAFVAALLLYLSVIGGLIFYLAHSQEWVQRFSSKKESFLDITLVERPKPKQQQEKKPAPKPAPPKPAPEPKPKQPEPPQPKPAPQEANVRDLFRGIDTATLEEPKPIPAPKPKTQNRAQETQKTPPTTTNTPSDSASKLVSSLELESTPQEARSKGTYDPFLGEITELLEGYWQETIDTVSGAEATVSIRIDHEGNFSYSIVTLSYNNAFNAKLRDFLEQMRSVTFPPYEEGDAISLTINFKDMME